MMMDAISYSTAKKCIAPLDLILFRGSEMVSRTIRFLEQLEVQNGEWSHCGLVVTSDLVPTIRNAKPDRLYVWESTLSGQLNDGVMDVESNAAVFGVQVRPLDKLVIEYNKPGRRIAWAKLLQNPCNMRDDEDDVEHELRLARLQQLMCALHLKYHNELYEINPIRLLAALFPCFRGLRNRFKTGKDLMFCSELVATVYCDIGVLDPQKVDPENVLPVDFIGDKDEEFKPVNRLPPILLRPHI
jgi:hypothetical protein